MPYELQTLERALDLLLLLSRRQPQRLVDLTHGLGTNQTTALRTLRVLEARGFIRRVAGQEYLLGSRLIELGHAAVGGIDVVAALHDRARRLSHSLSMTVHVGVLRDGAVTVVEKADAPGARVTYSTLGTRMPLHATAAGKASLALLPQIERERSLPPEPMPAFTPHSITRHAALLADIEKTLDRGFSLEREEFNLGFGCAGWAFEVDHDRYAVSVSGPVAPMPEMMRRGEALVRMFGGFVAQFGDTTRSLAPSGTAAVT